MDPKKDTAADEVIVESMAGIEAVNDVEYRIIDGFKDGEKLRIASLSADDMITWSEANEGEAKRTAGLRLITRSLVNKAGVRYADDPKNIAVFRKLSHKRTENVVREILDLNGMLKKNGTTTEAAAKNG